MSGRVADELLALLTAAADPGPLLSAYEVAVDTLETNLIRYGEARDNLPAMGVRTRIAFEGPLVIRFGVHEAARLVWEQAVRMNRSGRR